MIRTDRVWNVAGTATRVWPRGPKCNPVSFRAGEPPVYQLFVGDVTDMVDLCVTCFDLPEYQHRLNDHIGPCKAPCRIGPPSDHIGPLCYVWWLWPQVLSICASICQPKLHINAMWRRKIAKAACFAWQIYGNIVCAAQNSLYLCAKYMPRDKPRL